jgi:hypothetical protein
VTAIYSRKQSNTPTSEEGETPALVARMLREIEASSEAMVWDHAKRFDRWTGELGVPPAAIAATSRCRRR